LQGQLWINKKEIPNNGIDDDKNGYVDDVNGWNFIGHQKNSFLRFRNFEYTRIIKNKDAFFKYNIREKKDSLLYIDEYKRIEKLFDDNLIYYKNWYKSLDYSYSNIQKAKDTLKFFFPLENYNIKKLDSMYSIYKINDKNFKQIRNDNDKDLGALINIAIHNIKMGNREKEDLFFQKNQLDSIINKSLNLEYDDRKHIGDNPIILEKGYGNKILNNNTFQLSHNTGVSSIIAANRNNNAGTKGFHQNIKVMPLCISASGDEHDKDIAMAIYYAVDNGAKIINMSFGKEFSLKQEWVTEAFKYAEKNNVLLVHGSGNNSFSVDENSYYPSDIDYIRKNKTELVSNFINVGSVSKKTDSTMVSPFSNYGKQNVDIFAPGEDIYIAKPDNEYGYDSGTSFAAPMVSGTAALIWLYYPNLSVQEVKNIILESGVIIDKMVIKPGTDDEMIHFSELCKTGKILNTYNAMKMAEEVSKQKK
jgi:cell wall-associated protease